MLRRNKVAKQSVAPPPATIFPEGKTIIGEKLSVDGTIRGREDLVVDGSVKGQIQLEGSHLTVGPTGHLEADIRAGNVTISGRLIGNIMALDKVTITKDAEFNGEIKARRLSVDDGAYLKAVIELEREPEKKAPIEGAPAEPQASGGGDTGLTATGRADAEK